MTSPFALWADPGNEQPLTSVARQTLEELRAAMAALG